MRIESNAEVREGQGGLKAASVSAAARVDERPDPAAFVMSVAVGLFGLTIAAVMTMHFAAVFGWRIM